MKLRIEWREDGSGSILSEDNKLCVPLSRHPRSCGTIDVPYGWQLNLLTKEQIEEASRLLWEEGQFNLLTTRVTCPIEKVESYKKEVESRGWKVGFVTNSRYVHLYSNQTTQVLHLYKEYIPCQK